MVQFGAQVGTGPQVGAGPQDIGSQGEQTGPHDIGAAQGSSHVVGAAQGASQAFSETELLRLEHDDEDEDMIIGCWFCFVMFVILELVDLVRV